MSNYSDMLIDSMANCAIRVDNIDGTKQYVYDIDRITHKQVISIDMAVFGESFDKDVVYCNLSKEELEDRVNECYEYLVYSHTRIYFMVIGDNVKYYNRDVYKHCSVSRKPIANTEMSIRTHGYVFKRDIDWDGEYE